LTNGHANGLLSTGLNLLEDVDTLAGFHRDNRLLHPAGGSMDPTCAAANHARLGFRLHVQRVHFQYIYTERIFHRGLDQNLGRGRMHFERVLVVLRKEGVLLRDHWLTENLLKSQLSHGYATSSAAA